MAMKLLKNIVGRVYQSEAKAASEIGGHRFPDLCPDLMTGAIHFKNVYVPGGQMLGLGDAGCVIKATEFRKSRFETAHLEADEDEAEKQCCDFDFKVVEVQTRWMTETMNEKWVLVSITTRSGKILDLEVPLMKYKNLSEEIRKQYPQCFIHDKVVFDQLSAERFDMVSEQTEKFFFGGWHKLPDGRLQFLHNGMLNVSSKLRLEYDKEVAVNFWNTYLKISTNKSALVVALMFTMWAPLARLLAEKNMDQQGLRALLYVSAPTGTGKTSLMKILVRAMLDVGVEDTLRFDDTIASLEEGILMRKDIPVLVDDFFAQGNRNADEDFRKKANEIARIAGDGRVKGKMGPNRKPLPDREFFGTLIATGEYIDLTTHSSYLRTWQLVFEKGEIEFGPALKKLTADVKLAKAFFSGWVGFLIAEQNRIKKEATEIIQEYFLASQNAFPMCPHARFHANVAALFWLSNLAQEYLCALGLDGYEELFMNGLNKEAKKQFIAIDEVSPEEIFKKAVKDAVENGILKLARSESEFLSANGVDGFIDDGYWMFITKNLEDAFLNYAARHNYGVKLTQALKKNLVEAGVIVAPDGKTTVRFSRDRRHNPFRPRLYCIDRYKI